MKRKSGSRSYLQQLAQPVPPGATVLTARPVSAAYAGETAPQVPIIEDRFNFPDNDLTPLTRKPARPLVDPLRSSLESPLDPATGYVDADSSASESSRTAARHADLSRPSAEPGTVIQSVQHVDARSAFAHSAHEERSVEQPVRAETRGVVPAKRDSDISSITQSPQNEAQPSENQTAQRINASSRLPAVQEQIASSKTARDEPSSQFMQKDDVTERKDTQQAIDVVAPVLAQAAARQKGEKPEVRSTEGPRVHIGTVEIRAVLPQPVVPQPVTMTQNVAQNNAVTQARGRSGVTEPLARGLDWSYGLVQG